MNINTKSVGYSGNTALKKDTNRRSLFIVMVDQAGTVEFGNGGGKIPIAAGNYLEPYVCPTSEISIETLGAFVVLSNAQEEI